MCGRVNVSDFPVIQQIMIDLGLPIYPHIPPRYNISPGSQLPVFSNGEFVSMEWGIEFGNFKHPNTRIDTVRKKPFLHNLLQNNRCVIPINGFYEWPDTKKHPEFKSDKTRFHIQTQDNVMFLGGIFNTNKSQFNILTTSPNSQIEKFHHRMPVILPIDNVSQWISEKNTDEIYKLTVPFKQKLSIVEVDDYVDNARNEGSQCIDVKKPNRQLKLL